MDINTRSAASLYRYTFGSSFFAGNVDEIKAALNNITPRGTTPIAYSLEEAANDFPISNDCKNVIILITDGGEECGGDPCEVSLRLQKKNIFLRPFVIGIGDDYSNAFECVGTYLDATSQESFKRALNIVVSKALNNTSAQVNLLDVYGNPNESDVTMTFYDHKTGQIRYNYIHTLNGKGLPDTVYLDPVNSYDMVIHTIPPVFVEDINIIAGKHNILSADAPQGSLRIVTENKPGSSLLRGIPIIVKQHGKCNTINVQEIKKKVRYLVGEYDVEILTTPPLLLEKVEISQNYTTSLSIPVPGMLSVEKTKPFVSEVFVNEDGRMKLVKRLNTAKSENERLNLMPGSYILIIRPAYSRHAAHSKEYPFTITSGQTTKINLNP